MSENEFNYRPYLVATGIVLIIASVAPILFTKLFSGVEFGETTGPIGDTIGGITAPFLSLAGSILVFAALKAQVKANDIVLHQISKEEKQKNDDIKHKLEILKLDIEEVVENSINRAENLNQFGKVASEKTFTLNVLKRTETGAFDRIKSIDREAVYKGFRDKFIDSEGWVKEYQRLFASVETLDAFFTDIYKKYERHAEDIYSKKMQISRDFDDLIEFMATSLKNFEVKAKNGHDEYQWEKIKPVYDLFNQTIISWNEELQLKREDRQVGDETDMIWVSEHLFVPRLKQSIKLSQEGFLMSEILELNIKISRLRKKIGEVDFRSKEFGENCVQASKQLLEGGEDGKESVIQKLKQIKDKL